MGEVSKEVVIVIGWLVGWLVGWGKWWYVCGWLERLGLVWTYRCHRSRHRSCPPCLAYRRPCRPYLVGHRLERHLARLGPPTGYRSLVHRIL